MTAFPFRESAVAVSAAVLAACLLVEVPVAATTINVSAVGDWVHVYDPTLFEFRPSVNNLSWTWYVNDHTFVLGPGGEWHIFGITHTDPADPNQETNLAHAVSNQTLAPNTTWAFELRPFALGAVPPETHLWAPYIHVHQGMYFMFYCGGGVDRTASMISLATSTDLYGWTRHGPLFTGGIDGRDPMVLDRGEEHLDQRFVMYYTGTNPDNLVGPWHHVHYCRTSPDLYNWSAPWISFDGGSDGNNFGGPTESPFVVQRGVHYYLFTGSWYFQYQNTHVFHSLDPLNFGSTVLGTAQLVGVIAAHAPEVVRGVDGSWWVSGCGWGLGGVYLAQLAFIGDNVTNEDVSYPPIPLISPALQPDFRTNLGHWSNWTQNISFSREDRQGVGGASFAHTPSGLVLGDALATSAAVSPSWFLLSEVQVLSCSCDLVIATKDGNPTLSTSEGRFNTSAGFLVSLASTTMTTTSYSTSPSNSDVGGDVARGRSNSAPIATALFAINVTVNSHLDAASPATGALGLWGWSVFPPHNPDNNRTTTSSATISWSSWSPQAVALHLSVALNITALSMSASVQPAPTSSTRIKTSRERKAPATSAEEEVVLESLSLGSIGNWSDTALLQVGLIIEHGSATFQDVYCVVMA